MLTDALQHVSIRLRLRSDGGAERDPGGMQLGERERLVACVAQLADLGLATHLVTVYRIAIMRPGQAVDTSPGGPLVPRQQRARSGPSRRTRSAIREPR